MGITADWDWVARPQKGWLLWHKLQSHYTAQVGLKLFNILSSWDYRGASGHLSS
jgi:hypothetical protein